MTKSRSIQQPPAKTLRKGRGTSADKLADATEMVVAELRLRRERLQQLLNLIQVEAGHLAAVRKPLPLRHKCTATRTSVER
ncbi:MAG: hypothetical protein JWP63_3698 [Candidatus Solibacter sp.]|jgi:hypothetical protein|nr:hypothetical protein [Candidatus Solibacter sp.]